jgi:hypothetical protein
LTGEAGGSGAGFGQEGHVNGYLLEKRHNQQVTRGDGEDRRNSRNSGASGRSRNLPSCFQSVQSLLQRFEPLENFLEGKGFGREHFFHPCIVIPQYLC